MVDKKKDATFLKTTIGELDYSIDWSGSVAEGGPWLASEITISSSVWAIDEVGGESPAQLSEVSNSNTTTTTTIVVSGGTHGATYRLRNTVTLSNGMDESRTIYVVVSTHLPE